MTEKPFIVIKMVDGAVYDVALNLTDDFEVVCVEHDNAAIDDRNVDVRHGSIGHSNDPDKFLKEALKVLEGDYFDADSCILAAMEDDDKQAAYEERDRREEIQGQINKLNFAIKLLGTD